MVAMSEVSATIMAESLPLRMTIWSRIWYGSTMGRKQVLVQLDDDLISALDEVAKTQGVSRSELLRRGAAALLSAAKELDDERRHAEGYRKFPQESDLDEVWEALAVETLMDLPW